MEQKFTIKYGNLTSTAYVRNSEVYKIYTYTHYYQKGCYTEDIDTLEDGISFEIALKYFISAAYKHDRNAYNAFISALNEETLSLYFDKVYVPKLGG